MQVKIFTLPIHGSEAMEEEANRFLRSHRVMTVDRQFSPDGGGYWTLFVTYQDGLPSAGGSSGAGVSRSGKVDYREVLSPEEFGRFARYRDVRKELAGQQGVPAYAIFTDEELSQIARMEAVTLEAIAAIKNIGKRVCLPPLHRVESQGAHHLRRPFPRARGTACHDARVPPPVRRLPDEP